MPLPLLAIAAGLQVAGSAAKAVKGFSDLKSAKELARNNVRPQYEIEDEYYNNQNLAESNAMTGLSQQSLDYYGTQADRGLSAGIDASLRGGGGVNSVQGLYDSYLQGNARIAAEDSQLKVNNIKLLMDKNIELAGQKTQQWALNEYEPYKDRAKAASDARTAANANIWGGVQGVISGAATYAQSQSGAKIAGADGSGAVSSTAGVTPLAEAVKAYTPTEDPTFYNSMDSLIKKRYNDSPYISNFMTSTKAVA